MQPSRGWVEVQGLQKIVVERYLARTVGDLREYCSGCLEGSSGDAVLEVCFDLVQRSSLQ